MKKMGIIGEHEVNGKIIGKYTVEKQADKDWA